MFEEAARQHKRYEKVQEVLKLRDELARDVDRLNGVAITPSLAPDAVEMWFVRDGIWQEPQRFSFEVQEGKPFARPQVARDARRGRARKLPCASAQEYLALLARWYYSTWRRGRVARLRELRRDPLSQAGQRGFPRGEAKADISAAL